MIVSWTALKAVLTGRSIGVHGTQDAENYYLMAIDGGLSFECILRKANPNDDLADFTANYLPTWNALIAPTVNGLPVTRPATTKPGWHYCPRYFTWTTAKYPSDIHNRKIVATGMPPTYTMSDMTDAVVKWWKLSGSTWVELKRSDYVSDLLFIAALAADCTITTMDWHSTFDFDVVGCGILNGLQPGAEMYGYVIVAPDLPTAAGGSAHFLDGGFPFHLVADYQFIDFNGITAKNVVADPVTKTNKFRLVLEHAAGAQIVFSMGFKKFNA